LETRVAECLDTSNQGQSDDYLGNNSAPSNDAAIETRVRFAEARNSPDWVQLDGPHLAPFALCNDHVTALVEENDSVVGTQSCEGKERFCGSAQQNDRANQKH
jgi:hypothetical protein